MANIFDRIRASRIFQTLMRVFQFLSSIISLGLFSSRLYKIYRLEHRASTSTGAVEGILAAAVLYTLAVTLINCCLRSKTAPTFLRWLLIALDLLFVGAFIAVAELTKPNGGSSGNNSSQLCLTSSMRNAPANRNSTLCKLPLGTFILAIFSTILHFITAVFHEVRDKQRANKGLANNGGYKANGDSESNSEYKGDGNHNGNGHYQSNQGNGAYA